MNPNPPSPHGANSCGQCGGTGKTQLGSTCIRCTGTGKARPLGTTAKHPGLSNATCSLCRDAGWIQSQHGVHVPCPATPCPHSGDPIKCPHCYGKGMVPTNNGAAQMVCGTCNNGGKAPGTPGTITATQTPTADSDQVHVWLEEAQWNADKAEEHAKAAQQKADRGQDAAPLLALSAAMTQKSAVYTARAMLHQWTKPV